MIRFTDEQWSRWLGEVVADHLANTNGAVTMLVRPGSWTVFDEQEWTAFRLGANDGEFDRGHPRDPDVTIGLSRAL